MVLLSILIPTYNYAEGLERILSVLPVSNEELEILVFDDSPSPNLKSVTDKFSSSIKSLVYQHNPSIYGESLGAGKNWNLLLDMAKGKYLLLMHHDEFPGNLDFIPTLFSILKVQNPPDVVMLDLVLVDESLSPLPRHAPGILRWIVTQYAPSYLFCRNVIGPTASLVIRRSLAPRFDSDLRWLIDVDFYVKLCRSGLRWTNARIIQIKSVQRKTGAITTELADRISTINAAERHFLVKRYPRDSAWLVGAFNKVFRLFELPIWMFLRVLLVAQHRLSRLFRRDIV